MWLDCGPADKRTKALPVHRDGAPYVLHPHIIPKWCRTRHGAARTDTESDREPVIVIIGGVINGYEV